ncbi:RidA family protein [Actinoplanes siamensis]|uniref:Enamine deaminase RidA (YjgF/YER057c/UK114 family) n=1 Tax=Actinoplanes siamensis TaxID=1223317 RepID=A0A919NEQ5_9ACTN|nr:RidA family protein [Actinoplanes siamensis]GIF09350.1 hypothetical protein Asi03nite_68880 [Actinoplanes siamensis]
MEERQLVSGGSRFEEIFGYSRAVRVGPWIAVAGCTAAGPEGPVGGPDMAAQARECLRRIEDALGEVGASLTDVVRTRVFTTDVTAWERIGAVHNEFFGTIRPASTIVEVAGLARDDLLVEIEADAVRL